MTDPIDAELEAMLRHARRDRLTDGARTAIRARIARRLMMPTAAAVAATIGLALLAAWTLTPGTATKTLVSATAPATAPAPAPAPAPATAPAPAPAPATAPATAPASAPAPAPAPAPATATAPTSTLQAEVRLLTHARDALDHDDPRGALAALDEHARRFSDGVLRLDREAARWIARCQIDPAQAPHGLAFAEAHPRIPLAARIRTACGYQRNP